MSQRFPWKFTALWLVILCLMVVAGFWQLGRAEEKTQINQTMAEAQDHRPIQLQDWKTLQPFESVIIQGHYLDVHFLLANQIMQGQVGYFVFSAFRTVDNILLLINRGWVSDAQQDFSVHHEMTDVQALVADWPRPGVQLGEQILRDQNIQTVTYLPREATFELLKSQLCEHVTAKNCIILPRVLKLKPDMAHGFVRQWQLPRMTAEKHRAYAIQWFTMSLVLCLIYAVFLRTIYSQKKHAS